MLKGSSLWSLAYALSSLRNYPIRNMGIAVVLAIGVALPTTVFVWTETGTSLTVTDYFNSTAYQLALSPKTGHNYDSSHLEDAVEALSGNRYVEGVDVVPSTVGILVGESIPDWSLYSMYGLNYLLGIKDMRVLFLTEGALERWSMHFDYQGNFSLTLGQVLVSAQFVEYVYQVHNIVLRIGSVIDISVLRYGPRGTGPDSASTLGRLDVENLTVVGIYSPVQTRTLVSKSFIAMSRKNWDPFGNSEPVLGLADSVIILQSQVSESVVSEVANRGFYSPTAFLRLSRNDLMTVGAVNVGGELETFKAQLEETYRYLTIDGLTEIWKLSSQIATFVNSQILTIVGFPVLVMSLMLTVFTSESSIARRKGEISALRSKGASFNQVFSAFMWESMFLALIGFATGILLSLVMAPVLGASRGIFVVDFATLGRYMTAVSVPILSLVIGFVLAMCLPIAYLLHVARRIDVSEVGQPTAEEPEEAAEEGSIARYALILGAVLALLVAMPIIFNPRGNVAIGQILIATLVLFVASYLGSRVMRLVTARLSERVSFALGEKSLYLTQSLKRRKGQFIPLLVILTLTLTTTMMMLIQSSSFEFTVDTELRYAIGADVRIESSDLSLWFNETLVKYEGVYRVSPVIETWAQAGSNAFFLEGIDAVSYSRIGFFAGQSFVSDVASTVLERLASRQNGIVISAYHANLWNKTIGDSVSVMFGIASGQTTRSMEIVGIMTSAPGFGFASTVGLTSPTFASQFGFQVTREGFALVNLDFLYEAGNLETCNLFLIDLLEGSDGADLISAVEAMDDITVITPGTFDIAKESTSIQLFLSGIQGLTAVSFVLCTAMGLSAIALFLGSAVIERRNEYAIFRALGGTRDQVVSMVFGEFAGSVVAAMSISIVLGVMFGYIMSILTFGISPFSPLLGGALSFPVILIAVTLLLESVVMLLSCYIPARKAGSVDPAAALRNL